MPQIIVPQPCAKCTCRTVKLADNGAVYCLRCKSSRGTLDNETLTFIRAVEKNFGPLTEPIVLRSKNSTQARFDRHLANLASATPSDSNDANKT